MFIDNGDIEEGITLLCLYFEKIKPPQFDLSFELKLFIRKKKQYFQWNINLFNWLNNFFTKKLINLVV